MRTFLGLTEYDPNTGEYYSLEEQRTRLPDQTLERAISSFRDVSDSAKQASEAFARQSEYWHSLSKEERRELSKHGWPNWYINRGRIQQSFTDSELRRVSWRRAH